MKDRSRYIPAFRDTQHFIRRNGFTAGRLYLLLGLLLLLSLLSFTAGCSSQSGPENEPDLLVGLSFASRHVMIDNQNDFVWKKVTVRLNDKYIYKSDILPRGPSSIPLSEFLDSQGGPFHPEKAQPHRLIVDVEEGFNGQPGQFIW